MKNAIIFKGFVLLTFSHSIFAYVFFEGGEKRLTDVLLLGPCPLHPQCPPQCRVAGCPPAQTPQAKPPWARVPFPLQPLSSTPHTRKPEFPCVTTAGLSVLLWLFCLFEKALCSSDAY